MSLHRRLLAAAGVLFVASSIAFAQGGPPAMPVGVAEPVAKRVTQWDEFSGRFEALASVEVRARVSGFIDKLHFRDGQLVKAGDLLFTIDQRPFRIAVESNGTLPAVPGIDWLCISPKAGTEVVQRKGDELKLVWPQQGIEPAELEGWDFATFLVQPMDCADRDAAIQAAIALAMDRPRWRLSLQTHKLVGLA